MSFLKGGLDGQVEKVIDQAADVAKEKVGSLIGGGEKKDKKQGGGGAGGAGIGNMVSGAINKAAADVAADKAADKVMSIGKNLLG
ncbi:hypothetical protein AMEX_G18905 [Astyanax mexicanus]|uniref:Uncharacterized protein n=1 Tax=Astyanax mexicanus TaxID=7994 RepID=A0A8T2LGJ1_ASTMX|nr:hypothetical protein AMEX_G18905 [Astyanax mexicanus]